MSDSLWPHGLVAHQAPLYMGFSRQEYQNGLPFPSPGHLPNPGSEPGSPSLQANSLPCKPPGKPHVQAYLVLFCFTLLHLLDIIFFTIEQVHWHRSSKSIFQLHVSMSHFGNSHNVSNVFISSHFRIPWDTTILKLGQLTTRMTSKCSSEWKSCTPLTLHQKLEMIKFSEEGLWRIHFDIWQN